MILSLNQLKTLAASVGFPDPALAAAVAMAESGGNTNAYGDAQYGGSLGLWQINLPAHPQYQANPSALYDPTFNAKAALATSSNGTNWKPWTTYRTGAYLKWYQPGVAATAASYVGPILLTLAGLAAIGTLAAYEAGYFDRRHY